MDMNKTFFLKNEQRQPQWRVIDATGKVVGRLATEVADMLRGKDKALFTPHADGGDYIVIINADKVVFTGKKFDIKEYWWYTGYQGGRKTMLAKDMLNRHPDHILMHAIKGMLPKNKLSRALLGKLKIYAGAEHPHRAQVSA